MSASSESLMKDRDSAFQMIKSEGIDCIPVDPLSIAARHGWPILRPVAQAKRELTFMPGESEVARAVYRDRRYFILLNEQTADDRALRLSIAREIGRIVLGLIRDFGIVSPDGFRFCDPADEQLNDRSMSFAEELLAPTPLLLLLNLTSAEAIARLCQLPSDAAYSKLRTLLWYRISGTGVSDRFFQNRFAEYIRPVRYCGPFEPGPLDGALAALRQSITDEEMKPMYGKVPYVRTDANGRFAECPQCGNVSFSAEAQFCKLCGLYLYNQCGNLVTNDPAESCREINAGDARYCEKCGRPTILTRLGFLKSWAEIATSGGTTADGIDPSSRAGADSRMGNQTGRKTGFSQ